MKLARGKHRADARLLAQIAAHPANRKVSPLSMQRIIVRNDQSRRTVVRNQKAEIPRPLFSGQPYPKCRISNSPSEYHSRLLKSEADQGRFEKIRIFQKEWPLLGEKHFESLVDCVLRLVRFHLSKVRVDGRVQHQGIVKDEFRI